MSKRETLHDLIIRVLDEGFERDQAEKALVREEVRQLGTYWAGDEIWTLRRRVASLEKRLKDVKGRGES